MSTTFGILISRGDWGDNESPYIDVAFRSNGGYIRWKNPLAPYLSDDMRVWPVDNDCDDIITIGDLKKAIKKQAIEYKLVEVEELEKKLINK